MLGLGYKGDTVPEYMQGVCFIVEDDVGPVCLHLWGVDTELCDENTHCGTPQ